MPRALEETREGPAAVRAQRGRILNELLDGLEELAAAGVRAICGEIPAYAAMEPHVIADVHDQVARHYRANILSFLEERDVTLEDITFVRGAATRRARAGFALEDYLNAFRVGQQVLWEAIMRAAGDSPEGREAAMSLVTPVMRYADFASTHAARAYVEFAQYVVADADRERRDLLDHLLAGDLPERGPLVAAAQRYGLGHDTPALVAVAVAVGAGAGPDVSNAGSAALARVAAAHRGTLVVVRQSEIVAVAAVCAGSTARDVCAELAGVEERLRRDGMPLAMGVSTPAAGIGELPRAYQEARTALDCVGREGGVAALPRLTPLEYLLRRADDTARRLVDPRVRAFLDEDRERGGVLCATIRAFAECDLNLRAAAERLQIHPNTAQYRLGRVDERTGRNPRVVADLVELLVAMALDEAGD